MIPNALIVLSMVSSGLWGIFHKKTVEISSTFWAIILVYFFQFIQMPLAAVMCVSMEGTIAASARIWFLTLAASVLGGMALVICLRLLSRLEASFVLGCTAFYPVIAFFLAVWLLGEDMTFSRLAGTFVAGLGVLTISRSGAGADKPLVSIPDEGKKPGPASLFMLFVVALCWAALGILYKVAVSEASFFTVYFVRCFWDSLFFLAIIMFCGHRTSLRNLTRKKDVFLFGAGAAICTGVGNLAYLGALSMCDASLVISLTACYPIVMFVVSILFLKEKLNFRRCCGVSLIVFGSILVQVKNFCL